MSELKIEAVDIAGANPQAIALCLRGWNELFNKGLTDGRLVFHDGMSAIIGHAANGRDFIAAGVLLFGIEREFKRCWLTLSYVEPEFRGRGVYRGMWESLTSVTKANGVQTIEYATHLRNSAMREISKRMFCAEEFVILVHRLQG